MNPTQTRTPIPTLSAALSPTSSPTLNLNIERIVLDGLPVPASQRAALSVAITAELVRLLERDARTGRPWGSSRCLARADGPPIAITAHDNPRMLGAQLARAIFRSLTS